MPLLHVPWKQADDFNQSYECSVMKEEAMFLLTHLQACCRSGCSLGRAAHTASPTNWLNTWLKSSIGKIRWYLCMLITSDEMWKVWANREWSLDTIKTGSGNKSKSTHEESGYRVQKVESSHFQMKTSNVYHVWLSRCLMIEVVYVRMVTVWDHIKKKGSCFIQSTNCAVTTESLCKYAVFSKFVFSIL